MRNLRPNGQRAKTAITLLLIVIGMEAIIGILDLVMYFLLGGLSNDSELAISIIQVLEISIAILSLLFFVVFIVSAVTFISWFRRAYYNLEQLTKRLSTTNGWVSGSWFIPIMNLYRPYQIMRELYDVTAKILRKLEINLPVGFKMSHLGWWWGLWILNNIVANMSSRITQNAETLDGIMLGYLVDFVSNAISVGTGILAIQVIRSYTSTEPIIAQIGNTYSDENRVKGAEALG